MPPTRGLYSVVQYVPDDGRAEAANLGVVLYVPSPRSLEVRVSPTLERVRQFFRPGRSELRRIEIALEAFSHRMAIAREEFGGEEDLAQFAAARADTVRLSPPRLVMVENAPSEIDALYTELVGDREERLAAAMRAQRLPPRVAEVFGRLEAQGKVWRPGAIRLPTGRRFEVPIAFENGRVNYVRPESLATRGRLDDRMAKLGFGGRLIFLHPIDDKEGQLVVLSTDPNADPDAESRFARTLDEFNVRFVPHEQADEFAEEVERTAR
ncbi:MAG: DUF3037 domain-containing protein [Phycisphaeraceae bacterium]|nr:DUF3037 domain-containing protein [Phycisphaeraceae bacterium]